MLKTGDIIYKVTLEGYDIPCVVVKKYKVGQRLSKIDGTEGGGYLLKLAVRKVVSIVEPTCGVRYVTLLGELSNGKKVALWREIRFNELKDEEFCCYGRRGKKKRLGYGYIAPYDKESV